MDSSHPTAATTHAEEVTAGFHTQDFQVPEHSGHPLPKPVSDHTLCVVTIETTIPKSKIFGLKTTGSHTQDFMMWFKPLGPNNAMHQTLLHCSGKNLKSSGMP